MKDRENIKETANSGWLSSMRSFITIPNIVALIFLLAVLITTGNYGMFRDEYYYVACGERLDFGYVDHPPMVALFARLSTILFGGSLLGLRLFPALAGVATILMTARIARELGGGKTAQALAALMIPCSSIFLALFSFLSMNAFEILLWTVAAFVLIRLLNGADPKYWLLFGLIAGIGLQTKISMLVFGFSIVVGLLLTRNRKLLASQWPYIGGAIAFVIFLPFVIWQIVNGWPTLEFIYNATQIKNYPLSPVGFFTQIMVAANPVLLPVWLLGIVFFFFGKDSAKLRPFGYAFVIAFAVFVFQKSKFYYLIPIFPLLFAGGAVALERWFNKISWKWLKPVVYSFAAFSGIMVAPLTLPILPVQTFIDYSGAIGLLETIKMENTERVALPQHFADRFGWKEMVKTVSEAYESLPPDEKEKCELFAGNYGEAGALDFYGGDYNLPKALCGHNSYSFWGIKDSSFEMIIAVGVGRERLEQFYESVELVATHSHPYAMSYEAHVPIYVCKGLKTSVEEVLEAAIFFI